ncbi:MAG: MBL fold metallo-hydrolase [Gammaproteobacteria bacterium]|nr:MAG: MBL fold metallo-hydrolase [Gammaproteobacteria bacterium]
MPTWTIGAVEITRIIEIEDDSMPAEVVLPDARPEAVLPIEWLQPHFITADGRLLTSIQALLVASEGKRIVIDTCLGNDKPRAVPQWNQRQGAFLDHLAAAGFPRERVDYVVCTHLHPDHVGWNTLLENGSWVPTFPNARYLFTAADWDHVSRQPVTPLGDYCGDSVRPIVDAGLADLVRPDHRITGEVRLESTPGHSPGHVSVRIVSAGEEAVVTGDLMHHPCQIARPDWCSPFDFDPQQALATRQRFLAEQAGRPVLVIGTHFATPAAGRIVDSDGGLRLETSPDK